MDRREFLKAGGVAGVLGATTVAASAAPGSVGAHPGSPNILLLIADDQGLDAGCYGSPVKTPNLDRLAASGTLFTQAYATVSSCSSSRSVLYSGLYSHSNGMYGLAHDVHNQTLLDSVVTVPRLLSAAGYATALVGKKHIRPDRALPYDAELVPEQSGIRDVAAMAAAVGQFIRQRPAGRPFFITVGFSDPHRAPQNFGNTRTWPGVNRQIYPPAAVRLPAHLPDLPAVREDLAQYYESVSRLDSGVGLVLAQLAATGHDSDTLVIFLSDNGRAFPGAKTSLYDEGLHLPLIIRAPGGTPAVRCEAMVSFIDVVPTLLDAAHASGPTYPLPGRSLLPILGQTRRSGWNRVFASHSFHEINQYYPMRAVRTDRYTYIQNLAHELQYPVAGDVAGSPSWKAIVAAQAPLGKRSLAAWLRRPAEELYEVAHDPDQVVNLVDDAAHRDGLQELREVLTQWRASTRDPWLAGQTSPYAHSVHD